ncbi:MAG: CocE/NonD family hydrolase [Deltaproteobacteria bacterium]|nr:CocE/NonD family hydrolase [Deltaproteobacteria bacterium]
MDKNTTKTPFQRFFEEPILKAAQDPRPVFEVGIPMRDGVELAADVYLPIESERPAPVILQSTPYDKSNPLFFPQEARFYQEHGYAIVIHDVRGRGKSEGEWRAFVNDGRDTHDAIEWAAAQEWSNGRVGTTGVSYMGWTQWAAAAERPPHLRCMVSISAAGRWQQEIPFNNGVFNLYFGWWVYLVRRRISEFHGLEALDWDEILRLLPLEKLGQFIDPRGLTWDDMMEHETLDDFWKSIRLDDNYDQIDVPCLHVTGWYDLEDLPGAFHHYEHMMAHSPARDKQQLLVGPWSHIKSLWPHSSYAGVEFGPEAGLDTYQIHLRWFDYWLKGIDNGVPDDPPVRLFEPGRNVWRKADRWPLGDEDRYLYLRHDGREGRLGYEPPPDEDPARSYRYDPNDPAPTQMDVKKYPAEDIPLDQGPVESRSDVIVYTSEEMTEELVISGWAHLELFAASDCDDTEWHVKLTDVHPDGRSLKVCQGCLRASFRDSLEDPTPLQPGEVYHFDVELWPTHHVFLPGHRIRVSITSADFPWYARSMNRFGKIATLSDPRIATNTIQHSSVYPSRIKLPVAAL